MTNSVKSFALRFDSFRDFVDTYSDRLSDESLFLATDAPSPVGSTVEFTLSLSDDFGLLHGAGEVIWTIEGDTPGMAVRILDVDAPSQRLLSRLVENHREKGGAVFALDPPPPGAVTIAAESEAPLLAEEAPESPDPPVEEPAEGIPGLDPLPAATPAESPPAIEPSIDLTEAIDLSSTVPVGNALGMPFEPDSIEANPFEPQPFQPNEVVDAPDPAPPAESPKPPSVEPPETDSDELLSVPELATPEGESGTTEAAPVPPAPDLFASESDDPLGGFVRPEESPFEASAPLAPPVEMPDPPAADAWLPEEDSRPGRPWFKIALVLAVLAAALFAVGAYMGDFLSGRGGGEETAAAAAPEGTGVPAEPAPDGNEGPAVVLADNEDEPDAIVSSDEPGTAQPPAAETAPPSQQAEPPAPPPARSDAELTGIDRLTWRETPEGTVLVLQGDGRIEPTAFDVLRVSSGAPRAVIKIRGVTRPYSTPTTTVNTAQVHQVRSGFHVLPEGSEIHFVADLTSRDVEIAVASVEGRRLRVRFSDG